MSVLSTKVPIRKKSGNLFNDSRIYIYIERERERKLIEDFGYSKLCLIH